VTELLSMNLHEIITRVIGGWIYEDTFSETAGVFTPLTNDELLMQKDLEL
jgi:hypothetical protein